jgi:hypothetical protein
MAIYKTIEKKAKDKSSKVVMRPAHDAFGPKFTDQCTTT